LIIVSISSPARPEVVGAGAVQGMPLDVAVHNDYAYVAAQAAGLQILSVATPAFPDKVGSVSIPGSSASVSIDRENSFALVAARDGGLVIVSPGAEYQLFLPLILGT
jgi:hypothetical protein